MAETLGQVADCFARVAASLGYLTAALRQMASRCDQVAELLGRLAPSLGELTAPLGDLSFAPRRVAAPHGEVA